MHVKSLLDFGSKEWETLYLAISELIPPKDVNADISNATFNMAVGAQYNEQFPKDGSVHHVTNESDFMFGSWFPLNTMTMLCGVFMAKNGSLYYFGDSHVAKNIMEIKDNDWTVLGHHYPVAPVDTYFQLAAFLLFFTGQNELLNERLEALFQFTAVEDGDPQPTASDVAAVLPRSISASLASPDDFAKVTLPLVADPVDEVQFDLDQMVYGHYEGVASDPQVELANLERLEVRAAELLEEQEKPQVPKTIPRDHDDPLRKWAMRATGVVAVAAAGYGLYRFFRG